MHNTHTYIHKQTEKTGQLKPIHIRFHGSNSNETQQKWLCGKLLECRERIIMKNNNSNDNDNRIKRLSRTYPYEINETMNWNAIKMKEKKKNTKITIDKLTKKTTVEDGRWEQRTIDLEEVERKRNKIASNRFSNLLIELCSCNGMRMCVGPEHALEYKRQIKATKTVSKLLDLFDFTLALRLLSLGRLNGQSKQSNLLGNFHCTSKWNQIFEWISAQCMKINRLLL